MWQRVKPTDIQLLKRELTYIIYANIRKYFGINYHYKIILKERVVLLKLPKDL